MTNQTKLHKCISCEKDETIVPLVSIRFSQIPTWICAQCLPTLIHNPAQLESKFRNMDVENPVKPKLN